MQCLNVKNKEVAALLDQYTDILGSYDAAYYVLSENNGYGLDKAPNGEPSKLYNDLLSIYNNVVVLEDTFNKFSESEKQKLKYVALTRAKNKVLYYTSAKVNNRDITDVTSSKIKEMQTNAKRLSELGKERQNECK